MDDKRIEDMLKEGWKDAEPAGMRDRILRRCREEASLRSRRHPLAFLLGWKPALAGLALLIIMASSLYDGSCQNRIALMMDMPDAISTPYAICGIDSINSKFQLDRLLASQSVGYDMFDDMKGNGIL